MGYPFESWKLVRGAEMLADSQAALCTSVYCPVIRPHCTVRTRCGLWKHLLCFLMGQRVENMHRIPSEYTHCLRSTTVSNARCSILSSPPLPSTILSTAAVNVDYCQLWITFQRCEIKHIQRAQLSKAQLHFPP